MIPVYICDDNRETTAYLTTLIENLILISGLDMEVVLSATDPNQLLAHRLTRTDRAVYFLDVELNDSRHNGFTLAKKIREADPRGFIIFITTHAEMIFETFKYRLEAMHYLIKDTPEELHMQIRECLEEITRLVSNENRDALGYYTVNAGDSVFQIPVSEIICFETAQKAHRILLHTENRMLEFRGDLGSIERELGENFCKVHRSYLIHLLQIEKIHYAEQSLTMKNGMVCLISRKGKQLLRERISFGSGKGGDHAL